MFGSGLLNMEGSLVSESFMNSSGGIKKESRET
jgi:hypothetical protein